MSQEVFRGNLITVRLQTVPQPGGGTSRFEIVDHPDAVAIVAVRREPPDAHGEPLIALVRQPRPAIGKDTWEIPAGLVKRGERNDLQGTAARELLEETGYVADTWQPLCRQYPSPGFTNEAITVFLATDLRRSAEVPIAAAGSAYAEISEMRWLPLREALEWCQQGVIDGGTAILALQLARDILAETPTAQEGDGMVFDMANQPRTRAVAMRNRAADDEATEASGRSGLDASLKLENILLEEFNYASSTAYQAMEDRARMFNLYLIVVGVLASGLGAAYQFGGAVRAYLPILTIILLTVTGLLGSVFFLTLVRLRQAYRDSLINMNKIKQFYIDQFRAEFPHIDAAFYWRLETIPGGERFGSVTFLVVYTVAVLGSLCYAVAAFVSAQHWFSSGLNAALPMLSDKASYVLAFVVGLLAVTAHVLYYRVTLSKRKDEQKKSEELKKTSAASERASHTSTPTGDAPRP